MNTDVNGAVTIRRKITQSPPTEDMSNGWLAQPGVFLFDRESGMFHTRGQGVCKPSYPTAWDSHVFRRGRMSIQDRAVGDEFRHVVFEIRRHVLGRGAL